MTLAAIALLAFILGASLRHLQGGLDDTFGLRRWEIVVAYTVFGLPALYAYWGTPWLGVEDLGPAKALWMVALFDLDMVMSQDFSKPWKVLWRFGAAPAIIAVITGWWPAVATGLVLMAGTAVLKKWGPLIPLWRPYFDGWEAGWELMIGGVTGVVWTIAPLLG